MVNRDGEEFVSDLEDDEEGEYGEEGEFEQDDADDEKILLEQLTEKERAKILASGLSLRDYFAGEGPDFSDEEGGEEEQEEGDHADGDDAEDDDDAQEGVNGEKRAREE